MVFIKQLLILVVIMLPFVGMAREESIATYVIEPEHIQSYRLHKQQLFISLHEEYHSAFAEFTGSNIRKKVHVLLAHHRLVEVVVMDVIDSGLIVAEPEPSLLEYMGEHVSDGRVR